MPARSRRVLDVGSGTGNLTRAVAERWPGCEVVGVDPAPGVRRGRPSPGRRRGGARVRFELGEADALPLDDASVDAALALLVLNFVPDPDRAMAEMLRVTRPGGVLAAAVWDYGGGMGMLRTLWDAAARLDPACPARTRRRCRSVVLVASSTCGTAPASPTSTMAA